MSVGQVYIITNTIFHEIYVINLTSFCEISEILLIIILKEEVINLIKSNSVINNC